MGSGQIESPEILECARSAERVLQKLRISVEVVFRIHLSIRLILLQVPVGLSLAKEDKSSTILPVSGPER